MRVAVPNAVRIARPVQDLQRAERHVEPLAARAHEAEAHGVTVRQGGYLEGERVAAGHQRWRIVVQRGRERPRVQIGDLVQSAVCQDWNGAGHRQQQSDGYGLPDRRESVAGAHAAATSDRAAGHAARRSSENGPAPARLSSTSPRNSDSARWSSEMLSMAAFPGGQHAAAWRGLPPPSGGPGQPPWGSFGLSGG